MLARRALPVAGVGEVRAQAIEPNRTIGVRRRQHNDYRLVGGGGPGGERVDLRARGWLIGNFRQDVGTSRAHPAGQHAQPQYEICRHTIGFELVGDQSVQLLQTFLEQSLIASETFQPWSRRRQFFDLHTGVGDGEKLGA